MQDIFLKENHKYLCILCKSRIKVFFLCLRQDREGWVGGGGCEATSGDEGRVQTDAVLQLAAWKIERQQIALEALVVVTSTGWK